MSQLKEQNGRYYQQCKVVMLATEKVSPIQLRIGKSFKGERFKIGELDFSLAFKSIYNKDEWQPQHLYFLSDDEIKEGDWYYCKRLNKIFQAIKGITYNIEGNEHKIIATTDESLRTNYKENNHQPLSKYNYILPKPSDSFIQKYIEEYNKGNVITKILVEYINNGEEDWIGDDYNGEPFWNDKFELKVDSNNQITIKKVEPKLYTEEELKSFIRLAMQSKGYTPEYEFRKFIKENL